MDLAWAAGLVERVEAAIWPPVPRAFASIWVERPKNAPVGRSRLCRSRTRPLEAAAVPADFDSAMQRFRAASETQRSFEDELDRGRARVVAKKLVKRLSAAAGRGVEIRIE
ncbi:MAG TPA: hypothetical protein VKB88_35010 [Bryobacteraceae bacterium]|nr:hypothetical protein [Bryobacteraceae bacterium]